MNFHFIKVLIKKPKIVIEIVEILFLTIYRALSVRGLRGLMLSYPNKISLLAKKIPVEVKKYEFTHNDDLDQNFFNFKLATGYLRFSDKNSWKINFKSHEQYVSLHRWNWLLYSSSKKKQINHKDGMNLVRSWFSVMGVLPSGDAGESYTTAERLSNISLFSRELSGSWHEIPDDIQNALNIKIKFLAHRLEILPGLTGNHIINNARALLLSGYACKNDNAITLARTILEVYLPKVIDVNGFLIEGSSHYQLLICRWLLEMRFISEELNDDETLEILKEYIKKVIKASNFFLIGKGNNKIIPLIGDISPDCDPQWLLNMSESALNPYASNMTKGKLKKNNTGWSSLFSDFRNNPNYKWHDLSNSFNFWNCFENSGWFRLDYKGWSAIWHAEPSSGSCVASHAHHDLCSFVLYKDGKEIIIDPGRYNYDNSEIGKYGMTAKSHSTILLNGCPPALSRRDFKIPKSYRQSDIKVSHLINEDTHSVTISHNGFKRISSNIQIHTRRFMFNEDSVKITDNIEGEGNQKLDILFQISKNTNYKVCLDKNLKNYTQRFQGNENPISGWRFLSFGEKEAAVTLKATKNISLPFQCCSEIKLKN
tara:strand:+ start:16018 stop:17805 length:1788 start_codon:yes stop_codon:yes gene_type:complete